MESIIEWLFGMDPGQLGRGDSWRFAFVAKHSGNVKLVMIAVIALMTYLTVRSYRREGEAPRAAKGVLSGLRIAVILLAFMILFQPAVVVTATRTLYRSVVLLIDDSLSMSFKDTYADTKLDKPLAKFLGTKPDQLDQYSRRRIAREILTAPGGVADKLSKDHPLVVMAFSTQRPGEEEYTRKLATIPPAEDSDAATAPATAAEKLAPVLDEQLAAAGYETNMAGALWDALEATRGRRVSAFVVIGDGQATHSVANGRLASALAQAQRRVYTVCVGDPTVPRNVAVVGFDIPREARRNSTIRAAVRLAHRNCAGNQVKVRLVRRPVDKTEWQQIGVAKTVELTAGEGKADRKDRKAPDGDEDEDTRGLQTVTVSFEPDKTGQFMYKVQVTGTFEEKSTDDNSAEARVKISDEKINVLLVGGDAGWEFQRLRDLLYRSVGRYRTSVWQQNADPDINQTASTGMKISRLPQSLEELMGSPGGKPHPGYQVVVLYDPQPTGKGFDEKFVAHLKTFVAKHGSGLCYVAGNKYSESLLVGKQRWQDLADLLPVELGRNIINLTERISQRRPTPRPFRLAVHGVGHPVMRMDDEVAKSRGIWEVLPGTYWSQSIHKVKPIARVLAANPARQTARNAPEPLVVTQPFGAGRVLYVGTDETWRWLFVRKGEYYRRFWHNTMRYLAALKARRVVILTGGDRFDLGEKITITADAYDRNFQPLVTEDGTFEVDMIDVKTGKEHPVMLKAVDPDARPGRYALAVTAKHTGSFELTALRSDPLAREKVASKRIVVDLPRAEARRTEADHKTMAAIASRKPNCLQAHQIDKLAELIPSGRLETVHPSQFLLWDSYVSLLVIVALLAVEWILRKKYNMA